MYNIQEFRKKNTMLCDYLPWAALIGPGLVLNKDCSMQKTFTYRGRDLSSSTKLETEIAASQLNNILRRLPGGWVIYSEACRRKSVYYPEKEYPDTVTAMMDWERKKNFLEQDHFESVYYVTLEYMPPEDALDKFISKFMDSGEKAARAESARIEMHMKNFKTTFQRVFDLFNDIMAQGSCHELDDEETLTYLHDCISVKRQKVKVPDTPMYLDGYLYDSPLTGGIELALGTSRNKQYIGVVSVLMPPDKYYPGILDGLNRLNMEYRWCTRFIALDKADALAQLDVTRRNWFSSQKSLWTVFKEAFMRAESAVINFAAVERYNDTQAAITEIEDDICSLGYYTNCIVVMDEDKERLDQKIREVERVLNYKGFTSKYEDYNAFSAWIGSLPGVARANIRWPYITSLELSYLFQLSAVWAGDKWNKHLNAPALLQAKTAGSTPFRFNLHYQDFGNAMVIGPIGSGKSVLLNTIEMHCRGYKNAKVYIFDKGGSCRASTAGVGGIFYDLGTVGGQNGQGISFQPLRYIDNELERIWANEWLQMIYAQQNVELTPDDRSAIWDALTLLASSPADERTMSAYYMLVQSNRLKSGIVDFVDSIQGVINTGPYGKLFGANKDWFTDNSWQAFEMGELLEQKGAVMPTLQYLFHVIEKNCKGEPTFIFLDECWVFLANPLFAGKIKEWIKTMRKNNVSIIFATQSLNDVTDCEIAPAIIESCFTRVFLPNPNALSPGSEEIYLKFSLNDTERSIIATSIPKRQYYFKSILGSRLFELDLSPFLLAYVGSASKEDQAEIRRIQSEYAGEDFNLHWLQYKNLPQALEFYQYVRKNGFPE